MPSILPAGEAPPNAGRAKAAQENRKDNPMEDEAIARYAKLCETYHQKNDAFMEVMERAYDFLGKFENDNWNDIALTDELCRFTPPGEPLRLESPSPIVADASGYPDAEEFWTITTEAKIAWIAVNRAWRALTLSNTRTPPVSIEAKRTLASPPAAHFGSLRECTAHNSACEACLS